VSLRQIADDQELEFSDQYLKIYCKLFCTAIEAIEDYGKFRGVFGAKE
jgi:hypothetical protein